MYVDAIAAGLAYRPLSVSLAQRVHVGQDLSMDWDVHPGLEMVLHRTGRGRVSFGDGAIIPFSAGSIEIYAPGLPHRLHPIQPTDEYFLRVEAIPAFATLQGTSLMLPTSPDATSAREFATITEPSADGSAIALAERNHRATALLLRLLPHAVARAIDLAPTPAERHAAAARAYLRAHAPRVQFIEEVATALGLSHSHLRHVVKEVYGHSLVREWMEARCLLAEQELRQTTDSLAVISRRCGFQHENYFCRVFRRLRGHAPGALRQAGSGQRTDRSADTAMDPRSIR